VEYPVGVLEEELVLSPCILLRRHHLHGRYQKDRLRVSLSERCKHIELFHEGGCDVEGRDLQVDLEALRQSERDREHTVEIPCEGRDPVFIDIEPYGHLVPAEIVQVIGDLRYRPIEVHA